MQVKSGPWSPYLGECRFTILVDGQASTLLQCFERLYFLAKLMVAGVEIR